MSTTVRGGWQRRRGFAALAVALLALGGCGAAAVTPSPVPFTITAPATGTTVSSDSATVSGTAPAGATITDEALFAEVGATADGTGHWSMVVKLKDGLNNLTFQLNNDQNTRTYLQLTFSPTPTPTPSPTAAPTPTPFVITGLGAADADWEGAHTADPSGQAGAVYNYDPAVGGDRYYLVSHDSGRVDSYSIAIVPMRLADAEAIALSELPPDARALWSAKRSTCEQVEYGSAILGQALAPLGDPSGQAIAEFNTLDLNTMTAKLDVKGINQIVLGLGSYRTVSKAPPC